MHNQHITVLAKNYMVSLHGEFISDSLFLPLTPLNATLSDHYASEQGEPQPGSDVCHHTNRNHKQNIIIKI